MLRKELGKITSVEFGFGGYQGAMIGLSLQFGADGWGVSDFKGYWATKRSDTAEWSEADRVNFLGKTVMEIADLLEQAKKSHVMELKGVPVEITFDGTKMLCWRILTEVV